MSLNGLNTNAYPLTLDGTIALDVSSLVIDGVPVDISNLVPYTGANQTLNMGTQNIQTSHVPATGNDVVNLTTLTNAVTFVDTSVSLTYLNKITSADQTVAGKVTYTKELVVSPQKRTDLAGQVVVDASYQNLVTSASVTVGQYFVSVTFAGGGVYQATCTNNPIPTLILFPITSGNRYRFQIETLVEDATYDWTVDIYQSQDNVNPYPNFGAGILDSKTYSPGSVIYQAFDVTFVGNTTGSVVATISGTNPSGVGTVQWKNLKVFEMGVALTNASMPSLTADRVMVLNEKKQLVASGINTTKLGYLDNVSSDIQTQLNTKASTSYVDAGLALKASTTYVDAGLALKANLAGGNSFSGQQNYSDKTLNTVAVFDASKNLSSSAISTTELNYLSGVSSNIQTQLGGKLNLTGGTMTGAITMNGNKITTSYTPVNAEDLTRKGYVDSAISGATAGFVLKAGDTMTGTLFNSGGDFKAYRGGDTNKSCTLYANNADGSSYATHNGGLASWNGIGLYCNLDSTARHVFGTRDGSTQQLGKLTCVGVDTSAIINSGVTGNTTANIKFANSLSHIDNAAGEVYLFTGFQGHMAIGRNTLRDATTANLCLGVASTEESQIISVKTDNSGYLPLTLASSRFVFSSGNVGIGQTAPFAPLHFANTVANRKLVLYQSVDNNHEYYGFGINDNMLRYQIDQSSSSHTFYCGNGTAASLELMTIKGTGQLGFSGGGTGYAIPENLMTKRGAVSFGSTGENYGGGWQAGLMLECQNTTEFSCHDAGNRLTSFIYYDGANRMLIGRDIGWGRTPVEFRGDVQISNLASNSYAVMYLSSLGANCYLFLNANDRSGDGGASTATLRNDNGGLRLQSSGGNGFTIDAGSGYTRKYGGDNSKILFGANGTWGAYLLVGSGTSEIAPDKGQLISTNGNVHLDGGIYKDIYIGYYPYANNTPNNIRYYGNHYFTGSIFAPVAAQRVGSGNPNWGQIYTYDVVFGDMTIGQCEYYHSGPNANGFQGDWRGRNATTQFYKKDSVSSVTTWGYATGYQTSTAGNINIDIRIYSQSTGQFWYSWSYMFANYSYSHMVLPISINWGVLPAGWYDVYTYTSTTTTADANDFLSLTHMILPNGCNR